MSYTAMLMFLYAPVCYTLAAHAIADFKVQTSWQASNKSKSNEALLRHIATYAATIFLFLIPLCLILETSLRSLVGYVLINSFLHFCTDYVSSRISSKMYAEGDDRGFWFVIGLDQLAHQIPLIILLPMILL
jgi:hypothetical protein